MGEKANSMAQPKPTAPVHINDLTPEDRQQHGAAANRLDLVHPDHDAYHHEQFRDAPEADPVHPNAAGTPLWHPPSTGSAGANNVGPSPSATKKAKSGTTGVSNSTAETN